MAKQDVLVLHNELLIFKLGSIDNLEIMHDIYMFNYLAPFGWQT